MKFPEPKTIQGAMSPTFLVRWIMGVGIFEYPVGHLRPTISLLWSFGHIIMMLNVLKLVYFSSLVMPMKTSSVFTSYRVINFFSSISVIATIILGRIYSKNTILQMRQITAVNENFRKLGIPGDYGLAFKSQLFGLIGTLVLVLLRIIGDCIIKIDHPTGPFTQSSYFFLIYYGILFGVVTDYTFCARLRYVRNMIRRLNAYLVQSAFKEKNSKLISEEFDQSAPAFYRIRRNLQLVEEGNQQWTTHVLQETRYIHRNLCKIVKKLNNEFDICILLTMMTSFGSLISLLYSIYIEVSAYSLLSDCWRTFGQISWSMIYVMRVFSIVYICSTTTSEVMMLKQWDENPFQAQKTGQLIHELLTPTTSHAVREEIHTFSLQLLQNPLEFTASGFFTLDYKLICQMAGSVTTYLVIMIQMQNSLAKNSTNTIIAMNATG